MRDLSNSQITLELAKSDWRDMLTVFQHVDPSTAPWLDHVTHKSVYCAASLGNPETLHITLSTEEWLSLLGLVAQGNHPQCADWTRLINGVLGLDSRQG